MATAVASTIEGHGAKQSGKGVTLARQAGVQDYQHERTSSVNTTELQQGGPTPLDTRQRLQQHSSPPWCTTLSALPSPHWQLSGAPAACEVEDQGSAIPASSSAKVLTSLIAHTTKKQPDLQFVSCAGLHSAVRHIFSPFGHLPRWNKMDENLKTFFHGLHNTISDLNEANGTKLSIGKDPMSFRVPSGNTEQIMLRHMTWQEDAMWIYLCDQTGVKTDPRSISPRGVSHSRSWDVYDRHIIRQHQGLGEQKGST
eukprot:755805-Hanusia_phi.AAC.1